MQAYTKSNSTSNKQALPINILLMILGKSGTFKTFFFGQKIIYRQVVEKGRGEGKKN